MKELAREWEAGLKLLIIPEHGNNSMANNEKYLVNLQLPTFISDK